jgi:hypothetical protein
MLPLPVFLVVVKVGPFSHGARAVLFFILNLTKYNSFWSLKNLLKPAFWKPPKVTKSNISGRFTRACA